MNQSGRTSQDILHETMESITKLKNEYPNKLKSWGRHDTDKWWNLQLKLLLTDEFAEPYVYTETDLSYHLYMQKEDFYKQHPQLIRLTTQGVKNLQKYLKEDNYA